MFHTSGTFIVLIIIISIYAILSRANCKILVYYPKMNLCIKLRNIAIIRNYARVFLARYSKMNSSIMNKSKNMFAKYEKI